MYFLIFLLRFTKNFLFRHSYLQLIDKLIQINITQLFFVVARNESGSDGLAGWCWLNCGGSPMTMVVISKIRWGPLLTSPDTEIQRLPLKRSNCEDCWHLQTSHLTSPQIRVATKILQRFWRRASDSGSIFCSYFRGKQQANLHGIV